MDLQNFIMIEREEVTKRKIDIISKYQQELERTNPMSERAIELRACLNMFEWLEEVDIHNREYKIKN